MDNIRGVSCSLPDDGLRKILTLLSQQYHYFYIPWIDAIYQENMVLAEAWRNFYATAWDIEKIAKLCIWELTMYSYPIKIISSVMETYEDFIKSPCACCLIYYDCGMLDMYIKERKLFDAVWRKLEEIAAENLVIITDENDTRTGLA